MGKYDIVSANIGNENELFSVFGRTDNVIVLDIGSNDGLHSIRYSQLFTNSFIHAFEPIPSNVQKMRENFEEFNVSNRIKIYEIALSDTNGTADFYLSSGQPPGVNDGYDYGDKSSSLFPPDLHLQHTPWCKFTKSTIKTCRYENLPNKPERPSFLHMDVQGAELKVLSGFGKYLNNVKCVWLEVEKIPLYAGQPLYGDVKKFMEGHGFKLIKDAVGDTTGDQFWLRK